MLEDKLFLTPNDILEKEFKLDARGFRPQEVDKFLDLVIKDYYTYETIIKRLSTEIRNLENDNSILKSEIRDLRSKLELAGSNKNVTNIDILKRISELEKIVYGDE